MTKKPSAKKVAAKKPVSKTVSKKKYEDLLNEHKNMLDMSFDMGMKTLNIMLENSRLRKKVAAYEKHISTNVLNEIVKESENDELND